VIDQPRLRLTKASSPNGYTTVGAYSTQDIGVSTGCQIDVLGVGYNNIDILNYDAFRPHA
jgi:hypothetical protein